MKEEYQEKEVKCTRCGVVLRDKQSKNVLQCLPCFANMQSDDDEEIELD
jgi:uncharacterized paraquat-inducible protein A